MTEAEARRIAAAIFETLGFVATVRIYPTETPHDEVRVVVYQLLSFSEPAPAPFVFTRESVAAC